MKSWIDVNKYSTWGPKEWEARLTLPDKIKPEEFRDVFHRTFKQLPTDWDNTRCFPWLHLDSEGLYCFGQPRGDYFRFGWDMDDMVKVTKANPISFHVDMRPDGHQFEIAKGKSKFAEFNRFIANLDSDCKIIEKKTREVKDLRIEMTSASDIPAQWFKELQDKYSTWLKNTKIEMKLGKRDLKIVAGLPKGKAQLYAEKITQNFLSSWYSVVIFDWEGPGIICSLFLDDDCILKTADSGELTNFVPVIPLLISE